MNARNPFTYICANQTTNPLPLTQRCKATGFNFDKYHVSDDDFAATQNPVLEGCEHFQAKAIFDAAEGLKDYTLTEIMKKPVFFKAVQYEMAKDLGIKKRLDWNLYWANKYGRDQCENAFRDSIPGDENIPERGRAQDACSLAVSAGLIDFGRCLVQKKREKISR
jgi:hypothetical protein